MISVQEEKEKMGKPYNAMTTKKFFCDFCMTPFEMREDFVHYSIIKHRMGDGYEEARPLHVCEKCMAEIVRVEDRMIKGEL